MLGPGVSREESRKLFPQCCCLPLNKSTRWRRRATGQLGVVSGDCVGLERRPLEEGSTVPTCFQPFFTASPNQLSASARHCPPTTQLHANPCIPTALAHAQHWRRRLSGDCGQPEVVPGDCVQPGNCSLHSHITFTSRLPHLPCHLRLHLHHIVIQTITKAAAGDWLQPVVGSGDCAQPGPRFFTSFY